MKKIKYEKKKFFGMKIYMEKGMGGQYRPDNFFPILFLEFIPEKLFGINKVKEEGEWKLKKKLNKI